MLGSGRGGCTAAGTGSVSTSIPVPTAEAAVAVVPSAVPTVTSGEEEAAGGGSRRRMRSSLWRRQPREEPSLRSARPSRRVVTSRSSSMGVGGRRRVRSLMGCAVRGKGTTVGDGGDGLAARSKLKPKTTRDPNDDSSSTEDDTTRHPEKTSETFDQHAIAPLPDLFACSNKNLRLRASCASTPCQM